MKVTHVPSYDVSRPKNGPGKERAAGTSSVGLGVRAAPTQDQQELISS